MLKRDILAGAALLLASATVPAAADQTVWHLYKAEDGGGTLASVDAGDADSSEPLMHFSLVCMPGETWSMTITEVDAATLGKAIIDGTSVEFSVVVDGNPNAGGMSGYLPEINFGEMYGEWEYSAPIDLETIATLAEAQTLAVKGTGVDMQLPPNGQKLFSEFVDICSDVE